MPTLSWSSPLRRLRRSARSPEIARRTRKQRLALDPLEGRWGASTWAGVVNNVWSNAGNWDVLPTNGASLVFPVDGQNRANTNDLDAGTSFSSLILNDDGYAISGNAIALTGPIVASQDSGANQVSVPIQIDATTTVTVATAGSSLELGGVLSGAGGLVKDGAGTLTLSGANTYLGSTQVNAGTLRINGTQTGGAVIVLSAGTTVGGTGSLGSISSTGGTVAPGNAAPGLLTLAGSLDLDASSTFSVALNGLDAGDQYSQVQVAGSVSLGGAALNVSLGFQPTGQPAFVIVDNLGSDPVVGTFAGKAEGSTFTVSTDTFRISYAGGDGNDVVLTRLVGTTTALEAAPTSSVFGQQVTLTATVSPVETTGTVPAGSVTFFAGTTPLETVALQDGKAILVTDDLAVGNNTVTAQYLGGGEFAASSSTATAVAVSQAATTTTLEAVPTATTYGEDVELTATVAVTAPGAGTPTGTVTFLSGSTSLGTATLENGVATLNTAAIPAGTNAVTAQYAGATNFEASASGAATVTVAQAATTTTLTANPTSTVFGQSTTLTATVAVPGPGAGTPTGTVEFFDGDQSLGTANLQDGVATLDVADLPVGSSAITAQYAGDGNTTASTSDPASVIVAQATTTTTVSANPNPAAEGEMVTLTATVAVTAPGAGTPTGTVEFFNGSTSLGTAPLVNGVATLPTSSLPRAANIITAQYAGDNNFEPSLSAPLTVNIRLGSTTTVAAEPGSSTYGQQVTLTATVAPAVSGSGEPTGQVEFFAGQTSLGTAPLVDGQAVLSTTVLPAGSNALTARYLGDADFVPSTSTALNVSVAQAATTTTLGANPTSSVFGQSVTLTATVAVTAPGAGTPTGTVEFFNGSTSLGTATLQNGNATLATSALPVGTNAVTARYVGDANFVTSTSAALDASVAQAATATSLAANPTSTVSGQSVTLTATVAVTAPGAGTPTGTVEFFNGSTSLGTAAIQNGTASLSVASLPVGANAITARYVGNTSFATSTSTAATVAVAQAATTVALATTPNPSLAGQPVSLTATVAVPAPGAGTPTGTVEFFNGSTSLGTATIQNGTATLTTSALLAGASSLTARYVGDTNFATSTSAAVNQQVNRVATTTTLTASNPDPAVGESVTLTAVVAQASGTVTPTGTVQFLADGVLLGAATLSGGQASLTLDALPAGVLSVTARYQGDSNAEASTSPALSFTVGTANERYVNQLFLDIMGRDADPGELDFWSQALDQGRRREVVAASLVNSREAREFQVQQTYLFYLGREATPAEAARTIDAAFRYGTSIEGVVLSSREYFETAGGGTVVGYVDALANDLFGTSLDLATQAFLVMRIREGTPLVDVVRDVLMSPPGRYSLVQSSIETILGRSPDAGEVEATMGLLDGKILIRQVQVLLYASDEFYELSTGELPVSSLRRTRSR